MEHTQDTNKDDMKRVQVSFTREQWDVIQNLDGTIGSNDAEIVRNIVISWLAEKSFISKVTKNRMEED